jgi:hypothetical protein
MREIEHLIAFQAPFEEVLAKIDGCLAQPGTDAARASIEHFRVRAYTMHGRPADECAAVIDAFLALQPELTHRAQVVLAACGLRPELAPRYLDAIVADVEAAAAAAPEDQPLAGLLEHAHQVRDRVHRP